MTHIKVAGKWLIRLALCGLLAVVAFAVTVLIILPRATHGAALTVLTGSMTPGIPVGSVVIDRPVDPATLKVGDIATYQKTAGKAEYITHRIVAINTSTTPETFTFKGDANPGPDIDPVPATAIRGKVWFHVPYLGAIRDSIQSHGMRGLALLAAVLGLVGFGAYQVVSGIKQRGRGDLLVLRFAPDAFGDIDPATVGRLFGGECSVDDQTGVATLTFEADATQRKVVSQLLAPYQLAADRPAQNPEQRAAKHRVSANGNP
jgi:signal peptidase